MRGWVLMGVCVLAVGCGSDEGRDNPIFTTSTTQGSGDSDDEADEDTDDAGDGDTGDGDTGDGDADTGDGDADTGDGDADTGEGECGDGIKQGDEECDGNDLNGLSCLDFGFQDGSLVCADDCTLFTMACSTCGNSQIEGAEACDSNNFNGLSCQSLGYASGSLSCSPNCTSIDETGCQQAVTCGNGQIDPGEECDSGNLNGQTCQSLGFDGGSLSCTQGCLHNTANCTVEMCAPLLGACNFLLQDCCEGLTCALTFCVPEE